MKGVIVMNIVKNQKGSALEVALEGRLDTVTAPELQAEMESALAGVESVTFDLTKLEYISSAGLRTLLYIHKQMMGKGGMKLENLNEIVREVFDVTGFSDVLTIA